MKRNEFLHSMLAGFFGLSAARHWSQAPEPEAFYFEDDGLVPNNRLPLLLYRNAFAQRSEKGATWLEHTFRENNWYNSWRNGIFTFQHYHSIAHEVLGIYSGQVLVLLGGDQGKQLEVQAGTIIVIPAGVGHKNLGDHNLGVVGAYPNGMPVDVLRAEPGDRPQADQNIAAVPLPAHDPFLGKDAGLIKIWD